MLDSSLLGGPSQSLVDRRNCHFNFYCWRPFSLLIRLWPEPTGGTQSASSMPLVNLKDALWSTLYKCSGFPSF